MKSFFNHSTRAYKTLLFFVFCFLSLNVISLSIIFKIFAGLLQYATYDNFHCKNSNIMRFSSLWWLVLSTSRPNFTFLWLPRNVHMLKISGLLNLSTLFLIISPVSMSLKSSFGTVKVAKHFLKNWNYLWACIEKTKPLLLFLFIFL